MYIILILLIVFIILLLYYVFDINIKKIKEASKDNSLEFISEKIPANKEVCEGIFKILNHKPVLIEEDENSNTSLYIAISNKIILGKISFICLVFLNSKYLSLFSVQLTILLFSFFANILAKAKL